ncbi:MAG: hypothetical protein ACOYBC_07215 [Bilifractor sp.]
MWKQKLKSGNICCYERYKDPLTGRTRTATVTIKPTGRKCRKIKTMERTEQMQYG